MTAAQHPPAAGRDCPRCATPLAAEQEWCLGCGAAVGTRIAPRPSWKAPAAIVTAIVFLVAGALTVAFLELSDDADRAARAPAPAPVAAVPSTASPTPTAAASPSPAASPTPAASPSPDTTKVASWPAGTEAWTVVLLSTTSRSGAEKRAKELGAAGTSVGLLDSDDFSSLRGGYWVVFSGQYETVEEARTAAAGLGAQAAGAYARLVKPR